MEKLTITFRLDSEKVGTLDTLAEALDRDRSYLLNEAVRVYLDAQQWHLDQIKTAIRQADAGELIGHAQVRKQIRRLSGKRRRR